MWNSRNLSLMVRILTVKALGISNIIYSMTIVDCNMTIITEAQRKIDNFVWGNGTHKIKHSSFIANYNKGGLQMIDIKSMNMALRLKMGCCYKRKNQTFGRTKIFIAV